MITPAVCASEEQNRVRVNLAAALLFTTPPTDRALTGWHPGDWAAEELQELGWIADGRVA